MNQFFESNMKVKVSIAFLLALLAFLGVQFLSNKSIDKLNDGYQQVSDNRQLIGKMGTALSSLKSYHSKITEFVLTGNEKFLGDYEDNLRDVNINLQNIFESPLYSEQGALVGQLDSLVKAEIAFCQQSIIAYDKNNRADAIALINTGTGDRLINDINTTAKKLRQIEEYKLSQIIISNASFSNTITVMDYVASAFAIILILFSIFVLFRDISKRILIEKQLRLAQQRAEESAIMKEQFMANMSHEIRTPMNAILGFTNVLSETNLDSKQKKYLQAIQTSGNNLLNIVNDILDFSKIDAGMVMLEKIPFSPAALLHSIKVMFQTRAAEAGLQFSCDSSIEIPRTVVGDPSRLTQILLNLVNNAFKFTSEGSVTVKADLIREENENVFIQFIVKDTGIGIPDKKFDEIFERFIQANPDTGRKYGGSGLGLSIVKKLVELQGGTIRLESAVGVGSSFIVVIPYKKTSVIVGQVEPKQIQKDIKANTTILVAEDNLLNQELIITLLAQWNFEYDVVDNGNYAIEKLKQREYDLVLMDIQMPEMNGYETSKYIRQKLKLSLPIIAMTAHVLPGEKDKCLSYGMTDYISKPILANELYELISKYISKERKSDSIGSHVINLDYVTELSQGDPAFVNKMIQLFLTENPKEIKMLEDAVYRRDMQAIQSISHNISSSVPFVGLNLIIGSQLSSMEKLAQDKINISSIEKLFSRVKEVCLNAVEELRIVKANYY